MSKKVFHILSILLAIAVLTGASASIPAKAAMVGEDAPAADAQVKVAHFAPFANSLAGTSVTVKINGSEALSDFQFGEITGALSFAPGSYLIEVIPTGTTTVAISGTVSLAADTNYTLSAIGNSTNQPLELFPLVDETMAPASGAKLRVAHLAPFANTLPATEVDICTDNGTVILDNVPYKGFTDPYLTLPAGDYDLKIAAPDDTCSTTFLDLPSVRLADGDIRDVFAIGDITNQPLAFASVTGLALTPPAKVNVAHFAPFANTLAGTSVTVKINGSEALTDFQFGELTGYLDFEPGSYLIEVLPTGTSTVAISGTVNLMSGMSYTLPAIGNGTNQPLELFPLVDETMAPASGAKLRVAHLAPFANTLAATEVDICTDNGTVILDNVPYKGFTDPYLTLPTGDYNLKIAAPDDTCSITFLDLPAVRLADGDIRDVFAIGDIANQPLQVASGTGLVFAPDARVKVAHFAPFAGDLSGTSVTVRVNGNDALSNFKFGEITGYLDFEAGSYDIEILPSGTSTVAISGTVSLTGGMDYTLSAIGDGANQSLELFALQDDNTPLANDAKLRIVHFAPFANTIPGTLVDICTETNTAILSNVPYKGFTDPYLQLAPGVYDLKVTAAGSSCGTTLIDVPEVTLVRGMIASVFAIGDGTNFTPSVLAIFDRHPGRFFFPIIAR
jgi:hypothetical protein